MTTRKYPRTQPRMSTLIPLPSGSRARKAYTALRKSGFSGAYAAGVVGMLEHAHSNMERWIVVQRALLYGPASGQKWLKAKGYND